MQSYIFSIKKDFVWQKKNPKYNKNVFSEYTEQKIPTETAVCTFVKSGAKLMQSFQTTKKFVVFFQKRWK